MVCIVYTLHIRDIYIIQTIDILTYIPIRLRVHTLAHVTHTYKMAANLKTESGLLLLVCYNSKYYLKAYYYQFDYIAAARVYILYYYRVDRTAYTAFRSLLFVRILLCHQLHRCSVI